MSSVPSPASQLTWCQLGNSTVCYSTLEFFGVAQFFPEFALQIKVCPFQDKRDFYLPKPTQAGHLSPAPRYYFKKYNKCPFVMLHSPAQLLVHIHAHVLARVEEEGKEECAMVHAAWELQQMRIQCGILLQPNALPEKDSRRQGFRIPLP